MPIEPVMPSNHLILCRRTMEHKWNNWHLLFNLSEWVGVMGNWNAQASSGTAVPVHLLLLAACRGDVSRHLAFPELRGNFQVLKCWGGTSHTEHTCRPGAPARCPRATILRSQAMSPPLHQATLPILIVGSLPEPELKSAPSSLHPLKEPPTSIIAERLISLPSATYFDHWDDFWADINLIPSNRDDKACTIFTGRLEQQTVTASRAASPGPRPPPRQAQRLTATNSPQRLPTPSLGQMSQPYLLSLLTWVQVILRLTHWN